MSIPFAMKLFYLLLIVFASTPTLAQQPKTLLDSAVSNYDKGLYGKASIYLDQIHAKKSPISPQVKLESYYLKASIYERYQVYDLAIPLRFAADKMCKSGTVDCKEMTMNLSLIAEDYVFSGEYQKAEVLFTQVLEKIKQGKHVLNFEYNNMASCKMMLGKIQEAKALLLFYSNDMLHNKQLNAVDSIHLATMINKLQLMDYYGLASTDISEELLLFQLHTLKQLSFSKYPDFYIRNYIYSKKHHLARYNEEISRLIDWGNCPDKLKLEIHLFLNSTRKPNNEELYQLLYNLTERKKSFITYAKILTNEQQISAYQTRLTALEKEQVSTKQLKLIYISSTFALLSILMLILFFYLRKRYHQKIGQLSKAMIDQEKKLDDQFEFQRKMVNQVEHSQIHINLVEDSVASIRKEIKQLSKKFSHSDEISQGLKLVNLKFIQLQAIFKKPNLLSTIRNHDHESFIHVFLTNLTELSTNEKAICIDLINGLPTKEIAFKKGVSEKTIYMAKYKIKKKIGVPVVMNLNEYLLELMNNQPKKGIA